MKKFIALFLSVCMCVSFMASVVYADETEDIPSTEQTTEETTVETTVETTEQTTVETEPESEPEVCTGEDQQSFNSDETAIEINETNFPDANFRDYVSTNFDSDSNGVLSASEIDDVEDIVVAELNISSLKGIEYFTKLQYLYCSNNQLTVLDVSKNVNLYALLCHNNQLTTLDVSKNVNLEDLVCYNNQLTALDVSKNVNLENLMCYNNQLTTLDVSKNVNLENLMCYNNQLTALDVSKNVNLENLTCYNNQLTTLDVSKNVNLKKLNCYSNQLTKLDVSNNLDLELLYCNDNKLTALDVSKNVNLEELFCFDNQLTKLDLSLNSEIKQDFLLYDDGVDVTLPTGSPIAIEINEENFPDEIFRSYVSDNFDENGNGYLSASECRNAFTINITNKNCTSLNGIENFTKLEDLYCFNNQLTALDVSKNVNLSYLDCSENKLTTLDVSKNVNLSYLDCSENKLTTLDVSKNVNLTGLSCSNNQLTTLDVSKNVNLSYLDCSENKLTTLDVSKNVNLTGLSCSNNQLTALDVSNNNKLTKLFCNDNQLTEINVGNNSINALYKDDSVHVITNDCSFSEEWSTDSDKHWHECTCGVKKDEADHVYDNACDADCNECGAKRTPADHQYKNACDADCNVCGAKRTPADHQYENACDADCNVCGAKRTPADHVFDNDSDADCNVCGGVRINETTFPDSGFRSYVKTNFDSNGDGVLSSSEINAVIYIDVDGCGFDSLQGIEYFTEITDLYCYDNNLRSLDVSKNTKLEDLCCRCNSITELDVRNLNLTNIEADYFVHVITNEHNVSDEWTSDAEKHWHECSCGKKSFEAAHVYDDAKDTSCNVCGATRAFHVYDNDSDAYCNDCGGLRIDETTFPDSGFRSYVRTNFDSNEDEVLAVSEINAIKSISISYSSIYSLKGIEYFTELTTLKCNDDKLKSIDLSKNVNLTDLNCESNQLTTLDVSENVNLKSLKCRGNHLQSLDVSMLTELLSLECNSNQLTSLDLSKNTKLEFLICSYNPITELDIRNLNLSYIEADDSVHLITKDHYYSEEWTTDSGKHWHECPCGKKIEEAEHVYENACDIDCNVCGATRTVTHNYGSSWTTNGTSHWHQCSCGNKSDVAAHSLKTVTTAATTSAAGKTETKCSVCGKVTKNTVINAFGTVSLSYDVYTYNGKAHKPDVTVKDTVGNVISSSNYTVSYPSKCTNVGTYTIKITFKGDYSGTTTITYKIKPAKSSIKSLSSRSKGFYVKWSKVSKQISGYQIQYSTSSNFSSGTKTVNASWKSVSKTISKLKGKKKYYVRVRVYKTVNGVKYYSDWSSAKSITTKK